MKRMRYGISILGLAYVLALGCHRIESLEEHAEDPQPYRQEVNNNADRLLWAFETGDKITWSSPAIGTDGTVYIGSYDYKVYALNGKTGAEVESPPAIGTDGTVYFGSSDHMIYALDGKTGVMKWKFLTGDWITSSPAIGADGTIYIGSWAKGLYALDGTTGTQIWDFETGNSEFGVPSSPAIGTDGIVYVGSHNKK